MSNTPKKKIAVIGLKGLPAFGGAATVGENIINQLKDKYEFTVLSISSHATEENINDIKQVIFKKFKKGGINTFIYYIKCLCYVLFHDFDIIHLHHAESGFITPFLRLKYKVIVTFHGAYFYDDPQFSKVLNRFFRFSEKLNMKYANTIVSVSENDKFFLEKKYNKNVIYIPNGISNQYDEISNIKEIIPTYILFAAGRIYELKGLHILLKAMQLYDVNFKVIVAGNIDMVSEYKQKCLELSKKLNVEYVGLIKDKKELMELIAKASLFIFPSLAEAMSIMLLEVVSMKTPVIASNIPANRTIFSEDEIIFFENENALDLKDKIEFALSNENIIKEKVNKAYKKLDLYYRWSIIANQYKNIYNNLIK